MQDQFQRTELIIGREALEKLHNAKIAIFGIGGVGSFVAEGLVRAGVGKFILVDNDTVEITNLNRQLIATTKTLGRYKVEVMKERILEINPEAEVTTYAVFFMPNMEEKIIDNTVDYIVDAIDTVTAKLQLVIEANRLNIPIISSMGTGNKLNPTQLEVADISKTSVCPLAKVMRQELRNKGIEHLKVVYSKEQPIKPNYNVGVGAPDDPLSSGKKYPPGSVSFVPSAAGMIIASEVVKDLIK